MSFNRPSNSIEAPRYDYRTLPVMQETYNAGLSGDRFTHGLARVWQEQLGFMERGGGIITWDMGSRPGGGIAVAFVPLTAPGQVQRFGEQRYFVLIRPAHFEQEWPVFGDPNILLYSDREWVVFTRGAEDGDFVFADGSQDQPPALAPPVVEIAPARIAITAVAHAANISPPV